VARSLSPTFTKSVRSNPARSFWRAATAAMRWVWT
jgi:hypothetical protein